MSSARRNQLRSTSAIWRTRPWSERRLNRSLFQLFFSEPFTFQHERGAMEIEPRLKHRSLIKNVGGLLPSGVLQIVDHFRPKSTTRPLIAVSNWVAYARQLNEETTAQWK